MDETYSYRCGIYGNILINSNNKYCSVITRAVHNNEFDTETIKKMCDSLNNRTLESNGDLIVLIRLLYVDGIPLSTKELIVASLSKFIFWPHSSEDGEAFVNVMFWSESNILILLSSAVLFRQRNLVDADHRRICPTELEYQLLRCYLKAHVECSQKGSYEVLSLEHFPFALMALLNIVDFVMDFEFASLAMQLVDIMVTQLMHVTSASGVCCISSGARTNVDQRIRTWGHHINHFVYLLTGVHPNAKDTSLSNKILAKPGIGLGDAISARAVVNTSDRGSSYRIQPAPMAFSLKGGGQEYLEPCRLGDYLCCCEGFDPGSEATAAFLRQGYRQLAMNPSLEELQDFYTNYTPYAVNENESLEEKRLKRNKIMARNSKHNISTHSNKSGAENSSTIRLKPSMSGSGRGPRVYEVSLNGKFSLPMDPSGPEHSPGHSTPMSTIHRKRSKSMNSSNSISITLSNYPSGSAMKKDLSPFQCELIPFFWSAGLLAHRYFLFATKAYIKYRNLEGNKHLWLLSWLNTSVVDYLMKSYKQWTAGEAYVGMKYNIYKHDELLLTSFEKCNGGTCGYQMLPWIANFDGIGVWTQSGSGNESIGDVTVTNTHTPHVSQLGHILVAAYSTCVMCMQMYKYIISNLFNHISHMHCRPRALTMAMGPGAVFNSIVKLYWPSSDLLHNEERTDLRGFRTAVEPMDSSLKGTLQMLCCMGSPASVAEHIVGSSWGPMSWWLANRNGYLIGICCTGETRRSSATTADNKDIGVKLHNDGYSKPYTVRNIVFVCY